METLGTWSPSPLKDDESVAFSQPAPSSVSKWSEVDSSAGLAAQKLLKSLDDKEKLIQTERKKAEEARLKCEALLSQLTARMGSTPEGDSRGATAEHPDSPIHAEAQSDASTPGSSKRKSPCSGEESDDCPSKAGDAADAPSATKKSRAKRATPSMVDIAPAISGASSDDEIPAPDEIDLSVPAAKQPQDLFRKLESIVTAYKLGEVNPKSPDCPLGYTACAELCEEEMREWHKWTTQRKAELHSAVVSAIRVVFPDKKPEWFQKAFIKSPVGAADYWYKVIERRALLWRAAEKKQAKERDQKEASGSTSLKSRIRAKIAERKAERVKTLSASKGAKKRSSPPAASSRNLYSSDDDSDPSGKAEDDDGAKMAPGPDDYTPTEIKIFAKMAKAIRDYDEEKGHSVATCSYIDSEFSDGTGRLARSRSKNASHIHARLGKQTIYRQIFRNNHPMFRGFFQLEASSRRQSMPTRGHHHGGQVNKLTMSPKHHCHHIRPAISGCVSSTTRKRSRTSKKKSA